MAVGSVLKTILGGAIQKYPIGAPVALGATAAAGLGVLGNEDSGWIGRNSEDPPLVEITRLGDELKDWAERPWDPENDKAYIDETINRMHSLLTDQFDTMAIPRSSAREKATDYVSEFLRMASEKEGAPEMLSVKDEKVIYGAVGASPPPNPFTKDLPEGDTLRPGDFK